MAGSRIRGITLEIGGDTTKLDKAIGATNRELATTQRNLKDVERLLKLDPGNTELLAQKQRLLAQAADETKNKLNTLRQAAEGADQALERGQAYEAKYTPLKEAISQVTDELNGLEKRAESVEANFQSGKLPAEEYEAFWKTVKETEDRLNDLKKAKQDLQKEFDGTKLNQEQFESLQREIIQTEKDLESLEDQMDSTGGVMSQFSGNLSSVSDRAGKVHDVMQPVTNTILGIGAAAIATVPATESLRAGLGNIEENARNAGIGLDVANGAMRQMNMVSGDLDGAIEATNNLLNAGFTESNLQRAVENLAGAYIKFPETFKFESLADSLQETLATGEATGQFAELLDRLGIGAETFNAQMAVLPDEVERQNYALGLLASTGLSQVYEGWKQNNQELAQGRDATLQLQMSMARLAESLQPIVTGVTQVATAFLDWFNGLPQGAQVAIGIIALLVASISPIAGIISAIGVASTVSSVAFSKWALIIAAVVLALAALAAIIAVIVGKGDEMNDTISNVVGSMSGSSGSVSPNGTGNPSSPSAASLSDFPHFASGGVFAPNNPMLGVLGDNPREVEIAAPRSAMQDAFLDALDQRSVGAASKVNVSVRFTGSLSQLGRLLQPVVTVETARQGPSFTK